MKQRIAAMNITKRTVFLAAVLIVVVTWASIRIYQRPNLVITFDEAKLMWDGVASDGSGFTYVQVVDLVGAEGVLLVDSEPVETSDTAFIPTSYRWDNPEGFGWVIAEFEDDHLVRVKAHIDLYGH